MNFTIRRLDGHVARRSDELPDGAGNALGVNSDVGKSGAALAPQIEGVSLDEARGEQIDA